MSDDVPERHSAPDRRSSIDQPSTSPTPLPAAEDGAAKNSSASLDGHPNHANQPAAAPIRRSFPISRPSVTGGLEAAHKAGRSKLMNAHSQGIFAALASAFFLGAAPVFGRQAILLGLSPLAVVAIRTLLAALLLLGVMFIFYRPFLYIYPAGLLGCLLAGWVNGFGSLFYYSSLGHIGAGVGQLLYSLYPLFLALWLALDNQTPTRLTILRMCLVLPAVFLLVDTSASQQVSLIGVVEMLIASALYALHLPINQRVLYDMPAPTVTVYTLLAMSAIVVPTYLFSGALSGAELQSTAVALTTAGTWQTSLEAFAPFWWPILGLTAVTFLSRLTLFLGVKHLGGMQTALLGLGELLVTVGLAHLWLGESLTTRQWLGAILLVVTLMLVGLEKPTPRKLGSDGFLSWLRPAGLPGETWPEILGPDGENKRSGSD